MVEKKRAGFGVRTKRYWARSWQLWAMLFPAMLYIFVFCYVPMTEYSSHFVSTALQPGLPAENGWV